MIKDTQPMRKSASSAAFDRPKKMTKRRLASLLALMALAAPIGLTVAADATTDYDRNKNPRPEKSWHAVEASEAPTTVNIGRLGSENGTSNYKVAPNGVVVPKVFDRIKNTEGYIEMQARTEQQDKTFTEYEDRVGTLEGLDRHWNYDPSLDIASAWVTTNDPRITDWTPAIHRQLSGFQQSATFRVSQKRPVEEYEKNYVNGDERLTNIRIEQRTFNETRSRRVDVGLTNWINSGGRYDCTNWSPATNTIENGKAFTQTATNCKQNQKRTVSYTASNGENLNSKTWIEGRTLNNQTSTRPATGTKQECMIKTLKFDHWQMAWRDPVSPDQSVESWVNFYENGRKKYGGQAILKINGKKVRWCDAIGEAWPGRGDSGDCGNAAGYPLADSADPNNTIWGFRPDVPAYRITFTARKKHSFNGNVFYSNDYRGSWMFPQYKFWTNGTKVEICDN